MKFLRRLWNQIEGPPHISGGGDDIDEVDEDLAEEMPDAHEDVASLERAEGSTTRIRSAEVKFEPDIGPFEDAEHAHDEAEAEQAPPDVKS